MLQQTADCLCRHEPLLLGLLLLGLLLLRLLVRLLLCMLGRPCGG